MKVPQLTVLSLLTAAGLIAPSPAFSAGKARPESSNPGSVAGPGCSVNPLTLPSPVRPVVLRPIVSRPFPLPSGAQVDLSREMSVMLNSVVTQSGSLAPLDATSSAPDGGSLDELNDPCGTRIELRSAVTALEMNLTEVGVTIGFNPTAGAHTGGLTNLQGAYNAKISLLSMDFSLWQCHGSRCVSIAAGTADQNAVDQNLKLQLDFSQITTGIGLISHPSFSKILRSILTKGISGIASSPRLQELAWQARVREYNPDTGTVLFDQGLQARLKVGDAFTVYAADSQGTGCDVYKALAAVHATRVDAISSQALVDQVLDSRRIQPGDIVMIRAP